MARDIQESNSPCGVVGAGLMGSGIAAMMCAVGMPVQVFDTDAARLAKVPANIEDIVKDLEEYRLAEAGAALRVKERLRLASDTRDFETCGLVVEAVVEDAQIKRELYAALEGVLRPDAIIASNTSNIIPSVLVQGMKHPERFIVAHFWNPPYAVPLVEIVPAPQTNVQTIERTVEWVKQIGNEPVLLKKEVAGFIGNRLQYALLREALWLVWQGIASAEEVDDVMTLSLGRRYAVTGPFATADLGGLDTFLTISRQLMPELASNILPLQIMEEAVARGHVGMKSGRGLLEWSAARSAAVLQRRKQELLRRRHRETVQDESLFVS
jgi:3-hydroxybutyryl-CoA dehydrogenase